MLTSLSIKLLMENKCSTFKQLSRCPLIAESARATCSFEECSLSFCNKRKIHNQDMKTGKSCIIVCFWTEILLCPDNDLVNKSKFDFWKRFVSFLHIWISFYFIFLKTVGWEKILVWPPNYQFYSLQTSYQVRTYQEERRKV